MDNEFFRIIKELVENQGVSRSELADTLGCSEEDIYEYEKGASLPPAEFIRRAEDVYGDIFSDSHDWENVFVQGFFGPKVPLFIPEDLIANNYNRIKGYFEFPNLRHFGENCLFALNYDGEDFPEHGIRKGSILVFYKCDEVDREGIYAVSSRGKLTFKEVTVVGDKYRIVKMEGNRRLPTIRKTARALGRLVCCVNNYY